MVKLHLSQVPFLARSQRGIHPSVRLLQCCLLWYLLAPGEGDLGRGRHECNIVADISPAVGQAQC